MIPTPKPVHPGPLSSPAPRRARRRGSLTAAAAAAVLAGLVPSTAGAQQEARPASGSQFTEVGRLPVVLGSGDDKVGGSEAEHSGWLILNRTTRRAYQVYERESTTVVQSFDLDTLAPIRRAVLNGIPVVGGTRAGTGATITTENGEVVHAVDEEGGRVYLALTADKNSADVVGQSVGQAIAFNSSSSDFNRPVHRYVAIDEKAFDEGEADFTASFPEPAWPVGWLRGLLVDEERRTEGRDASGGPGSFGRLVSVVTTGNVQDQPPGVHQLRQWDVGDLTFAAEGRTGSTQTPTKETPVPNAAEPIPLTVCGASSMTYGEAGKGNYQWGLLLTEEGAFLGCQSNKQSARAAFVGMAEDSGGPTGVQLAYPLSRQVADVLVDRGGRRLLFKSVTPGNQTWWVFDAKARRFVGAMAAMVSDTFRFAAGVNEETGRLYQLVPDYVGVDHGRDFAGRGGLQVADTRLDPVPPAENVAPELAYPAVFRIAVDEQTRRVFVRRGQGGGKRYVYPGLRPGPDAPVEPHYLVLRDDRPVPRAVAEGAEDDRRFTTNAKEADGATKASYLGTGSGFGARTLLIGGLGAATDRERAALANTDCDKDDRELRAGEVESAVLSDVSAAATAASLAADARTEEQAGKLASRCFPTNRPPPRNDAIEPDPDKRDYLVPDPTELEFDRLPEGRPDGRSEFRTECTGSENPGRQRPPPSAAPGYDWRSGFTADVGCDHEGAVVTAEATGAMSPPPQQLDDSRRAPAVTVGHAETTVSARRRPGGGIVVEVDSVARDVVIEGIGRIGVVRAVATSEAGGRDGTARGEFTRTICGVHLEAPAVFTEGCFTEDEARSWANLVNTAMTGRMEVRVRDAEPRLLEGSVSGYRAGVQRRAVELFHDSAISNDDSLAVPGLELIFYRGDSETEGPGRQIVQLAGVQAGTSYGIACLYGPGRGGGCATSVDDTGGAPPVFDDPTVGSDGGIVAPAPEGAQARASGRGSGVLGAVGRLLQAPFRIAADVVRLLFSNPREFGLMAAVWALLYLPCYLGERRRALGRLAGRRLAAGGAS